MKKKKFIEDEIWTLVIGGAFQRANVYKSQVSEKRRQQFKTSLRNFVDNLTLPYSNAQVLESLHLENIQAVSQFTQQFSVILNGGQLNFGVSQKLLNLYLKYHWCLGFIQEPPHFPVDRIIQEKLKFKKIIPWTQITTQEEYLKIIDHARGQLNHHNNSLANLELELFNRRNSS